MPDIHGLYTMRELAIIGGVSSSWICKLRNNTGILDKGVRHSAHTKYTKDDVIMFKKVMLLRKMGCSVSDIEFIYKCDDLTDSMINDIKGRIEDLQTHLKFYEISINETRRLL